MKHKGISLLCAACLTFTGAVAAMPATTAVYAVETSGKCGENLTWSFDQSTGTLTIEGTGAMKSYQVDDSYFSDSVLLPWLSFRKNIKKVILPEGLTKLGQYAFYECSNLTAIDIPDSVTELGWHSFEKCSGLKTITIPDGVTSIGSFQDCISLTDIEIPNGITTIEADAFSGCTGFTAITLPETVTKIGQRAFLGCTGFTAITLPEAVTAIGEKAFYGCTKLSAITIPESVTYFGTDAFTDTPWLSEKEAENPLVIVNNQIVSTHACKGSVVVPEGIISLPTKAFYGNENLTEITIPSSCITLGADSLLNCPNLKKVTILNPNATINTGYNSPDFYQSGSSEKWAITNNDVITDFREATEYLRAMWWIMNIPEFTGTIYGYSGSTAEEFASGYCDFVALDAPAVTKGELDGKNGITADDAQITLMAAVNILANKPSGLTEAQELAADVDGNSKITAEDAQYILIYAIQDLANKNPKWSDIIK